METLVVDCLPESSATSGAWDLWAANVSDPSWTFDNILPVFQKSCNFTPPNLAKRGGPPIPINESAFVPGGGPLKVSFWGNYLESSPYTRAGLENFGLVENSNIQTGSMLGYAQYPSGLDPDAQIRDSSETSFGQYAIGNTDLKIYPNTLAKRIIFDGKKAIGVALETATQPFTLTATKEVVLAAGAVSISFASLWDVPADHTMRQFRTPQLLMVSGVGPSSQLEPLGIPIISELQGIGTNMWVSLLPSRPCDSSVRILIACEGPTGDRRYIRRQRNHTAPTICQRDLSGRK